MNSVKIKPGQYRSKALQPKVVLHYSNCVDSFYALWKSIVEKPELTITNHNREVVKQIIQWITNLEYDHKYDQGKGCGWEDCDCKLLKENKGLYIWGKHGRGKTSLIKTIAHAMNNASRHFSHIPSVKIYDYKSIYNKVKSQQKTANLYFKKGSIVMDDLGWDGEGELKIFGTRVNLVSDIIYNRHKSRLNAMAESRYKKEKTHGLSIFTSNISPEDILELYGEGVYSRLIEMCNIIHWDGDKNLRLNEIN